MYRNVVEISVFSLVRAQDSLGMADIQPLVDVKQSGLSQHLETTFSLQALREETDQ